VEATASTGGMLVAELGLHGGESRNIPVVIPAVPEGCIPLGLRLNRDVIPPNDLLEGLEEYSTTGDVEPYPESIGDTTASPELTLVDKEFVD
jgi:hypothetical protein